MNFEHFAARIADSNQIDNFDVAINEFKEQQRFTIIGGKMQKSAVLKTTFPQTNDKIFYYLNENTSLPMGHPYLDGLNLYKKKRRKT